MTYLTLLAAGLKLTAGLVLFNHLIDIVKKLHFLSVLFSPSRGQIAQAIETIQSFHLWDFSSPSETERIIFFLFLSFPKLSKAW